MESKLEWKNAGGYKEAVLLNPDGTEGVVFSMETRPSCYRRGRYYMQIEVKSGPCHLAWGCFDSQDQPFRYYHNLDCAEKEAQTIADVLVKDFKPQMIDKYEAA